MAFAQDNSTTGSTTGSDNDSNPNYLAGPNIQRFYTDESMNTLRPEVELKSEWQAMTDTERADAKQACMGNKDTRFNPLCNAIGAM